jgi:hypothetical protein
MWIEKQNTQNKVLIGVAITFLVYQLTIISKFNRKLVMRYLLGWLVVVLVLGTLVNWLVNNNHESVAWVVVLAPLVLIPTVVNTVCSVCKIM